MRIFKDHRQAQNIDGIGLPDHSCPPHLLPRSPDHWEKPSPLMLEDPVRFTLNTPIKGSRVSQNTHSVNILHIPDHSPGPGDGFFIAGGLAKEPGPWTALAVPTADCLALALVVVTHTAFMGAIVHVGWKGLVGNIHGLALGKILDLGGFYLGIHRDDVAKKIKAYFSPCIWGSHYPCGQDVANALTEHNKKYGNGINGDRARDLFPFDCKPRGNFEHGKMYLDLQKEVFTDLLNLGILHENVTLFRSNTFTHPLLPSHRRRSRQGFFVKNHLFTHLMVPPLYPWRSLA